MTHASVFSGIGGPELAATMLGWDNLFHCEINQFGRKVLEYWYPKAKSYEDITTTDFTEWKGRVNVLTGGFPCQPFSYAGKRRGAEDDRYLWPYMFRCIDQVQPDWIVAENVAGIITMVEQGQVSPMENQASLFGEGDIIQRYQLRETFTIQRICDDLESHGYSVQPVLIPACSVGAPHKRDRVFIIAHRTSANSNDKGILRKSAKHERESRQEQLQKRNKIQFTCEPVEIRRESEKNVASNSSISGEGTPRESSKIESYWSCTDQQPSERRAATEWSDRFYEILRYAADTPNNGLQYCDKSRSKACETGEIQEKKNYSERYISTSADGSRRTTSDTEEQQSDRMQLRQPEYCQQKQIQLGGSRCEDGVIAGIGRWDTFPTVSPVHRGNDGIPFDVDRLSIPFNKWRTESLKAYGNAIVPQVMYEIFRAIDIYEKKY